MRRLLRMAMLLAVLVPAGGCSVWQSQYVRADHLVDRRNPHELRVTLKDGSRVVLVEPEVVGDALRGLPRDETVSFQRKEPVTIPLDRIALCELRGDAGGGGIIFAAGFLLVGLGLVAISMSE